MLAHCHAAEPWVCSYNFKEYSIFFTSLSCPVVHRQEFISQREILGQDASAPFGAREREDHLLACRSFIPRDVDQHTSHSAFVGTTHYCLQITEGRLAPSTHLVGSDVGKQVCKYTQGKRLLFLPNPMPCHKIQSCTEIPGKVLKPVGRPPGGRTYYQRRRAFSEKDGEEKKLWHGRDSNSGPLN